MTPPSATASIEIAAEPAKVYGLITDLAKFAEITEETQTMVWKKGSSFSGITGPKPIMPPRSCAPFMGSSVGNEAQV